MKAYKLYYRDGLEIVEQQFNTIDAALEYLRKQSIKPSISDDIQAYYNGIFSESDLTTRLFYNHINLYTTK